jgi:hypothetical protein
MRHRGKGTSTAVLVAGVLAATLARTAQASEAFVSDYTSADTRKCRKFERVQVADTEYAAGWACKGLAGYVVVVAEEDLRTTVSVGRTVKAAVAEPAASQGFGPFNFAYDTVEWRSLKGGGKPFAIIQRWNISDNENPGSDGRPGRTGLLIVTRLPPGPVCHVAYVDVKANAEANVLARRAADEVARSFDCAKDPVRIIGARGRAIELSGHGKSE